MQLNQKHHEAVAALAELTPREIAELHFAAHNAKLHEAEAAKEHPLRTFALPDSEFSALADYLLDGGGVLDDGNLRVKVHQALLSRDQAAFWPAFAHWLKSRLKTKGNVRVLPHGGVTHSGVGA